MSKSRKKKSSKKKGTGQALGVLALIISMGALGFSLYQFFIPAEELTSEGPTIYSLSHEDNIVLDGITLIDYLYELDLTYSAQAGDRVLIEFNCEMLVLPISTTTVELNFDVNGTYVPSSIHLTTTAYLRTTGYMRHFINSSEAGEYTVHIVAYIDDEFTGSYIRRCLLTVTVY